MSPLRTTVRIALLLLLAASVGCSSAGESATTAAEALYAREASPKCSSLLFLEHPHTGTYQLSTGETVPTPFWSCDLAGTSIFGTVDYNALASLSDGTGFVPRATTVDGRKRGFARVYFNTYRDSDAGSYREFILSYDTVAASGDASDVRWVNPYSAMVPSLKRDTVTFVHRLYLDEDLPIAYGREIFGYDKRKGTLTFVADPANDAEDVSVLDELGASVATAHVAFDRSPHAKLELVAGLAEAMGLASLPQALLQSEYALATRDVQQPGSLKRLHGAFQFSSLVPVVNVFDGAADELAFGSNSEVGNLLSSIDFEPAVVLHDDHAKLAMWVDPETP
jgi:hypothetical protein